jgi:RNA polymerase sigma-70 factor (ECF subfamily)
MNALSDELLVAGMAGGDQYAAAAFVRRYQARVYGLALTIVRAPALAEDVAQEAFIKTWRHATTYDPRRGSVATWLLAITRNAAIDAIRYRRDDPVDPSQLVALLTVGGDSGGTEDVDASLELRAALAELPVEEAGPIVQMTFYGLTAQEIASRDDLPVGTVKTRVRRGLRTLRLRMGVRDA